MKHNTKVCTRSLALVAGIGFGLLSGGAVLANPLASAPRPASIQPALPYADAVILIRAHLTALQQAGETGDYNVLYGIGSSGFQAQNPPERLTENFAAIRPYNLASVLTTEPKFTEVPHLVSSGAMRMAGYFDHGGYRIGFQMVFTPEAGRWKLLALGAGVNPVKPPLRAPAKPKG